MSNPIKTAVLRALSDEIPWGKKSINDLTAQIYMNEHGTTYYYGGEEYHEPLAESSEAIELNAKIMREHVEGMERIRREKDA